MEIIALRNKKFFGTEQEESFCCANKDEAPLLQKRRPSAYQNIYLKNQQFDIILCALDFKL